MDFVDKYPKMSHLLKNLAFTEVYFLVSNNQVTHVLMVLTNDVICEKLLVSIGVAIGRSCKLFSSSGGKVL